mmetsp:Transcript_62452/g.122710  ORF Transcript_62452/g.122710 Transcript_62452/m.122710 type:complete len:215 (+) Transcript_62452:700-1344(+)
MSPAKDKCFGGGCGGGVAAAACHAAAGRGHCSEEATPQTPLRFETLPLVLHPPHHRCCTRRAAQQRTTATRETHRPTTILRFGEKTTTCRGKFRERRVLDCHLLEALRLHCCRYCRCSSCRSYLEAAPRLSGHSAPSAAAPLLSLHSDRRRHFYHLGHFAMLGLSPFRDLRGPPRSLHPSYRRPFHSFEPGFLLLHHLGPPPLLPPPTKTRRRR